MFSSNGGGGGDGFNAGFGAGPEMYANNLMGQGQGLGQGLGQGQGSGLLPYGLFSSGGAGNRGIVDLMDDINVQGFWSPSQPAQAQSSQLPLFTQQSGLQPHPQSQLQSQPQVQSQFWRGDSYGSTMGTPSFLPPQGLVSPPSLTSLSAPQDFLLPQNVLSSHSHSHSFSGGNNIVPPQGGSAYVNVERDGLTGNYDINDIRTHNINRSTTNNDNNLTGAINATTTSTNTITNNLDYEEIQRLILAELAKPAQSNI